MLGIFQGHLIITFKRGCDQGGAGALSFNPQPLCCSAQLEYSSIHFSAKRYLCQNERVLSRQPCAANLKLGPSGQVSYTRLYRPRVGFSDQTAALRLDSCFPG